MAFDSIEIPPTRQSYWGGCRQQAQQTGLADTWPFFSSMAIKIWKTYNTSHEFMTWCSLMWDGENVPISLPGIRSCHAEGRPYMWMFWLFLSVAVRIQFQWVYFQISWLDDLFGIFLCSCVGQRPSSMWIAPAILPFEDIFFLTDLTQCGAFWRKRKT